MIFDTTILKFTEIYDHESFYLEDKSSRFVEVADVQGTNCLCDENAETVISERVEQCRKSFLKPDPEKEASRLNGRVLPYGLHFMDNGNYHYMSYIFLKAVKEPFTLVVLDHHPDMQRPMFDILSCGGWVMDVAEKNEFVRDIHIIGADEGLIDKLSPEDRKRAYFYGTDALSMPGNICKRAEHPIYLSIDKDVINKDEIVTNWDQGDALIKQVLDFVRFIGQKGLLLGIDVCGECAILQQDCDIERAISGNDDFNRKLIELLREV